MRVHRVLVVALCWLIAVIPGVGFLLSDVNVVADPHCVEVCDGWIAGLAVKIFSVIFFGSALTNAFIATLRSRAIVERGYSRAALIASGSLIVVCGLWLWALATDATDGRLAFANFGIIAGSVAVFVALLARRNQS